ncbi:MAG: proliferating cell nuclear antigen (pcna) [Candidatus Woesearchaeota archaeon]
MKLVLAETKYFKEPVSIISDLVTEARFNIKKDSINLVAMDPANVAMVIFKLLSSSFIEYAVREEIDIAINLANLKQVLRRIKANDTLAMEIEENKFKITLKSNNVRTFYLPIIDVEEKSQKIPDLKFGVTVTTNSAILNDAIEDVDIVGESVEFKADEKKFYVSAFGDLTKAVIDINADEDTKIACKEKVRSKYSIEYLKKMIQGSKISDKCIIYFSKDYPLKLEYKVLNKVDLSFILAPRVEND